MKRYTSKVFQNVSNTISQDVVQGSVFSATSLSIKAQKKIASKLSNRNVSKIFLSDAADRLFDNLCGALKTQYEKKDAEKVCKNMIKLTVKVGILSHNGCFSPEEKKKLADANKKLKSLALTILSFHDVTYSYDRFYLLEKLEELKAALEPVVTLNLSDKSTLRLEHVFTHIMNPVLLDDLFKVNGLHSDLSQSIVASLRELVVNQNI